MFIRRESFRQFLYYYPVVSWIIGVNTVLFILTFFPFIGGIIQNLLIGFNPAVAAGEYWRLITPLFLHGSALHFLFNNFALVIFAPALEVILKKGKFIFFYLLAGLIGNIGTYFLGAWHVAHLGASGAIYGLFGMYLYMILYRKDLIDPASRQIVLTLLVIGAIYTFVMPGINVYAHLFGFIAGFALGPVLLKSARRY